MPVSPYARALVSINGAGNTSGGIDIPSACTVALTGESTVGWTQQIWEFIDFPEGWATPAGWTLGADGTIYSNDVAPTTITMPANTTLWGSWALRLRINQQASSSADLKLGLVDTATRFDMLSPRGQRDIGALEEGQFCTTTTTIKQWVRSYQRNLRKLEALAGTLVGITRVTANYTILATDYLVVLRTNTAFTATLPASPSDGESHVVKNVAAGNNTLNGGGHNIDGAATVTLTQYDVARVTYDATSAIWVKT